MRKKYLSALLFGALLFASAGTFTSCKDYDDDINNLQEQINTVKTDLESLKSTVEGLDGVKTLSYADGMLIIETGKGTKVEVPVPSATGVTTVELKDNVLYVDGKEAGKVEIAEGEAVKVEVKEDGKLYINGEVQDLEIGSKVVVVDNGNGTYTMTVDGESYVLPKASASIYSVELAENVVYNGYFTQKYLTSTEVTILKTIDKYGINWGTAAEDLAEWTGPKGAVKKGQLLLGAINTLDVTVTPKNADLTQAKLTLVDMNGKEAPATVTPSVKENDDMLTGSRAASVDGTWTLTITPTATAEEMATAYAGTNNDGDAENLKYALAVDGVVMTDYNFVIDTWTDSQVQNNEEKVVTFGSPKFFIGEIGGVTGHYADVPLGESKLVYKDPAVYDVQVDIAPESIEDASLLGVTVDKSTNTLVVSDKAANDASGKIRLNVTLLGVNGLVSETKTIEIDNFTGTTVDEKQTIGTTEYVMTASKDANAQNIIIDMEDVFSSLSAEQSTDLSAAWSKGDLFSSALSVKYFASLEDAKAMQKEIKLNDQTSGSRVKSIKYAVITIADRSYGEFKSTVKEGKYDLDLTLSTSKGEIKKVVAPINITLPTFESIFTKVNDNFWTDNERTVRMNGDGKIKLGTIFASDLFDGSTNANVIKFESLKYTDADGKTQDFASSSVEGTGTEKDITKSNAYVNAEGQIVDNTLDAVAYYQFGSTELKVKTSFTVKVKSLFEGAELIYYTKADTPSADGAVVNADNTILGGTKAGAGLALKYEGAELAMNSLGGSALYPFTDGTTTNRGVISGITIAYEDTPASVTLVDTKQVKLEMSVNYNSSTLKATTGGRGYAGITIGGEDNYLAAGQAAELVVKFTDKAGVVTTAKIKIQKVK